MTMLMHGKRPALPGTRFKGAAKGGGGGKR